MSNELVFFCAGLPIAQGSMSAFIPKGWSRAIITDQKGAKLKTWRKLVSADALQARLAQKWGVLDEPVEVHATFYLPKPKTPRFASHAVKPDLDKLCRSLLDGLTGCLLSDDSRVFRLIATKRYADINHVCGVDVRVIREQSLL